MFKRKMLRKQKKFKATKNFKNAVSTCNSKKRITYYNYGNKRHYKHECLFFFLKKEKDANKIWNSNNA